MDLITLQSTLDNLSFGLLLLTMLIYWSSAAFPNLMLLRAIGTAGMAVANLTIAALLAARWLEAGYFPLSNLYESLFFLAWGVTAIHLFAEVTARSRWVGVFTAPLAMGITAFAALSLPIEMQNSAPLVPALKSNWLMMHVSVMMLSYATLLVGSMLAIAFLLLTWGQTVTLQGSSYGVGGSDRQGLEMGLNLKGFNTVTPLEPASNRSCESGAVATLAPPQPQSSPTPLTPQTLSRAETLDNLSYRIIGLGFPLLTIGIIAGGVWANEAWGSYWSWDPKETWALITWLVFAAYLHARITKGWQGRKPALLAAGGFVVVWVCYLGVNLLGKGLHSYGWFF
ncbi:MAG: c-type cytochrome biogenesis protein CcsB [Cyanobacteria bacterium P01_G01_bin.54]